MRQQRTNVPQETDGGLSPTPHERASKVEANFEDNWPADTIVKVEYDSPFKRNTIEDDFSDGAESSPYFKDLIKYEKSKFSILNREQSNPNSLIPVQTKSSPVKKDRKLTLKPIVIEKQAISLLKPGTMDILLTKPYSSAVFLNCFVNLGSKSDIGIDFKEIE